MFSCLTTNAAVLSAREAVAEARRYPQALLDAISVKTRASQRRGADILAAGRRGDNKRKTAC